VIGRKHLRRRIRGASVVALVGRLEIRRPLTSVRYAPDFVKRAGGAGLTGKQVNGAASLTEGNLREIIR